jgi:hypothetical protein
LSVLFIVICNYSLPYPVDAIHIGIGIPGDTIGAGIGIQSHTAQLRNLSSGQQHVQTGGLLSPSVLLAVGAGLSAGSL